MVKNKTWFRFNKSSVKFLNFKPDYLHILKLLFAHLVHKLLIHIYFASNLFLKVKRKKFESTSSKCQVKNSF